MRCQFAVVFVGGQESRLVVSSSPFTAIRRYSAYLSATTETTYPSMIKDNIDNDDKITQGRLATSRILHNNPDDQSEGIISNANDFIDSCMSKQCTVRRKSSYDEDNNSAYDLSEFDGTYEDELNMRLDLFDGKTASLRLNNLLTENACFYRAYVDRAEDLIRNWIEQKHLTARGEALRFSKICTVFEHDEAGVESDKTRSASNSLE